MSAFLLRWFRLIWLFTRGHQALILKNLALRQQLAVYKRSKRPKLNRSDRVFWIALASVWNWMATSLGPGAPRHGGALATATLLQILGTAVG